VYVDVYLEISTSQAYNLHQLNMARRWSMGLSFSPSLVRPSGQSQSLRICGRWAVQGKAREAATLLSTDGAPAEKVTDLFKILRTGSVVDEIH
jgi:hypothetical protein